MHHRRSFVEVGRSNCRSCTKMCKGPAHTRTRSMQERIDKPTFRHFECTPHAPSMCVRSLDSWECEAQVRVNGLMLQDVKV